jgi:hypothetical protein
MSLRTRSDRGSVEMGGLRIGEMHWDYEDRIVAQNTYQDDYFSRDMYTQSSSPYMTNLLLRELDLCFPFERTNKCMTEDTRVVKKIIKQ